MLPSIPQLFVAPSKWLFIVLLVVSAPLTHAANMIQLVSDNGDYIGGGSSYEISSTQIGAVNIDNRQISISTSVFSFTFTAPGEESIAPGAFLGATRYPFNGPLDPGIDVSGQGRGCNTIKGEFYIYEVDAAKGVLALDFVQHCEGFVPALRGSIRINSAIAIPFSGVLAVATASALRVQEGANVALSASNTISSSAIQQYRWEQISGKPVTFANTDQRDISLTLPGDVDLGGETVEVKLTVTDATGLSHSTNLMFNVASKSDPETYFSMSGAAGDYISAGRSYYYDADNAILNLNLSSWSNAVTVSISGNEHWGADFAAPNNAQLAVGKYAYAERYPFQSSGAAGLSVSGNGRGCNQSFGSFEVIQISLTEPARFKARFEQHCEFTGAPALKGEIAFNALNENVPVADAGAAIEVLEGQVANLNGSASYDAKGSNLSFAWSTKESGINIQSATMSRANFTAPALANRQQSKIINVSLLIKNELGYKAKKDVAVTILSNNKAPVAKEDIASVPPLTKSTLRPLDNDSDVDGSIQRDSINIKVQPLHGSLVVNSDGTLEYNQNKANATSDEIHYSIMDNDGAESAVAVIKLTIKPDFSENDTGKSGGGGVANIYLLLSLFGLLFAGHFLSRNSKPSYQK